MLGCSGDRIVAPRVSPEEAARIALAELDANGDGFIDEAEAEKSPGLRSCLRSWSPDGKLSAEKIIERYRAYADSEVAIVGIHYRVYLDGQPLEGATVTFVPEKFMGPNIKPATGVTDELGFVFLKIDGEQVEGVHRGVYRVEVSKPDAAGNETIPARYNSETMLGQEIAMETGYNTRTYIQLRLTSGN